MDEKFSRWMKRIRDTRAEEIDCSECLDRVSEYVDLELANEDAGRRLPAVKQHLGQCTVCAEEYQLLRDLARMEQDGSAPSTDDLKDELAGEDDSAGTAAAAG